MKTKLQITIILPVLLSIFLSACGPEQLIDPTLTLTPTPTNTSTNTFLPLPTSTPTLTFTLTSAPTLTPAVANTINAGEEDEKGVFLRKMYESENGGSIPFQFLIPENFIEGQQYPLLVFLHGAGELGRDNSSQTVNFPNSFLDKQNRLDYPFFVVAPQCPSSDTWVSFPNYPNNTQTTQNPTNATRLTIELIEKLLLEYEIDKHRIYVTGLSLGGEGTFDIVSRRPDLFAAAVPICGIADTEKASSMKDVPFWIFHGENDDINPVKYSRMIVQALKDEGAFPQYTEYEGAGHDIWNRAYNEPDLISWLFSQQKK